jgi:membrane protein DedA with SNARE-associated domain
MIESLVNMVIFVMDKVGYFGVFLFMMLESACIPIPSEAILPFGGYLSYTGRLSIIPTILIGTLGGTFGSILAYYLGKLGGRPLVEKYATTLHLSKSSLDKSDRYFSKYGEKIVFYSRLLPIVRTFISLPAGISNMDFKKFTIYTFFGSLIWSILLGYTGYYMGENWVLIRSWFHYADIAIVIVIVGLVGYKLIKIRKAKQANKLEP